MSAELAWERVGVWPRRPPVRVRWFLTRHALLRANQMGLSRGDVVAVLDEPDVCYPDRGGWISKGNGLAVKWVEDRVITVLPDTQERYIRSDADATMCPGSDVVNTLDALCSADGVRGTTGARRPRRPIDAHASHVHAAKSPRSEEEAAGSGGCLPKIKSRRDA